MMMLTMITFMAMMLTQCSAAKVTETVCHPCNGSGKINEENVQKCKTAKTCGQCGGSGKIKLTTTESELWSIAGRYVGRHVTIQRVKKCFMRSLESIQTKLLKQIVQKSAAINEDEIDDIDFEPSSQEIREYNEQSDAIFTRQNGSRCDTLDDWLLKSQDKLLKDQERQAKKIEKMWGSLENAETPSETEIKALDDGWDVTKVCGACQGKRKQKKCKRCGDTGRVNKKQKKSSIMKNAKKAIKFVFSRCQNEVRKIKEKAGRKLEKIRKLKDEMKATWAEVKDIVKNKEKRTSVKKEATQFLRNLKIHKKDIFRRIIRETKENWKEAIEDFFKCFLVNPFKISKRDIFDGIKNIQEGDKFRVRHVKQPDGLLSIIKNQNELRMAKVTVLKTPGGNAEDEVKVGLIHSTLKKKADYRVKKSDLEPEDYRKECDKCNSEKISNKVPGMDSTWWDKGICRFKCRTCSHEERRGWLRNPKHYLTRVKSDDALVALCGPWDGFRTIEDSSDSGDSEDIAPALLDLNEAALPVKIVRKRMPAIPRRIRSNSITTPIGLKSGESYTSNGLLRNTQRRRLVDRMLREIRRAQNLA